ncbi:hypothetical protein MNBD_ALPHA12-2082 [hydrothermal vent metagenome]|uniref:histidine kinase n=1 Tax=hydrothermal vent metagenome TaxID=652676 RepID=A0A3B0U9F8_9ZZZZ
MHNDWIKTQAGQNIIGQFDERRPAWLWSGDGRVLLWQNHAGRLFMAKQKKDRIKLTKQAVPIKGQVRRLLRLGLIGLSSLARVQFLVGNKPVSATCSCTPVVLENNKPGLLIVGVDPIEAEIFENANLDEIENKENKEDENDRKDFEKNQQLVSEKSGDRQTKQSEAQAEIVAKETVKPDQPGQLSNLLDRLANKSQLFDPLAASDEIIPDELKQALQNKKAADTDSFIPGTTGREGILDDEKEAGSEKEETGGLIKEQPEQQETIWRVRGAGFTPIKQYKNGNEAGESAAKKDLTASDQPAGARQQDTAGAKQQDPAGAKQEDPAGAKQQDPVGASQEDPAGTEQKNQSAADAGKETIVKQEQVSQDKADKKDKPGKSEDASDSTPEVESGQTSKPTKEDRVANYNFEELSRILKNRLNDETSGTRPRQSESKPETKPGQSGGKTLNLSEEMLVLNRLPIGILIFKDQKILFANRAFAALMGSSSISRLHESGLGELFPQIGDADTPVGPVVSLVKLDGKQVLVDARLQTINWQGTSALMLSANEKNRVFDGEESIKLFTRSLAENKHQGYFETNQAGIIDMISQDGEKLLGQSASELGGSAISRLFDGDNLLRFQDFLRQKAQFAGAARPHIELDCAQKNLELEIFSQGRAGIVTGYFGIIRPKNNGKKTEQDTDSAGSDETGANSQLLARLSRGIRRPLNTILGFSELIYSEAFGALGNPRYNEYARDIKSAGGEIARLVDEMDEYSRLKSENFVPDSADFDLRQLLDECLRLVRVAANKRRVFVRSAVSETLPAICADRASMRQAILNLLASAIDQTPAGGKVILSAQIEDDGSVGVHVRDSAQNRNTGSERFVVFSESNSRRGEKLVPMKSSMGLALTRSLLAVNDCALHVDPSVGAGTLMSLTIPAVLFSKQD